MFDKKTINLLHHNDIQILFSNHCLYHTDTIHIVKMKILVIMDTDNTIDNLYLYSKQSEKIEKTDFTNRNILQNHDFLYNYFPIEDNCLYLSIEQDVMKEFIQLSKSKSNTMSFDEVVNGPGYRYGGQVKSTTHTRV